MNTDVVRFLIVAWLVALFGVATAQGLPQWFPLTFSAELTGDRVVPAVETDVSGSITAVLTGRRLVITGHFLNLPEPARFGTALHAAPPGEEGPVVELEVVPGSFMNGSYLSTAPLGDTISAVVVLGDEQIEDLLAGRWYAQLYLWSERFGEVRGQLTPVIDPSRIAFDPAALDVSADEFPGVWIARGDVWGFQYYPDGSWTYLDDASEIGEPADSGRRWSLQENILVQDNGMLGTGTCSGHNVWYLERFADGSLRMQLLLGPAGCGGIGSSFTYEPVQP